MDDKSISWNKPELTAKEMKKRYIKIKKTYNSIETNASNPQPGNDKRSRILGGLYLTDNDLLGPKAGAEPVEEPLLESEIVEILDQEITNLEITDLKSDANEMRQEIVDLAAQNQSEIKLKALEGNQEISVNRQKISDNRQEIEKIKSESKNFRMYVFFLVCAVLTLSIVAFKDLI
jgi:hypothetical protein